MLKCKDCGLVRFSESVNNIDNFYIISGMRNNVVDTPEHYRKTTIQDIVCVDLGLRKILLREKGY